MPTVAGLVLVHSRLAGESLTSCKDVQGPASVPVRSYGLYNIHTSLGEDNQNQPWWSGRVCRHPWLWDGVARPPKMHTKCGVQCQTRWVLSSIMAPGAGQPELSPKLPFSPISHVPFPPPLPCTHPSSTHSAQSRSSPGFVRVLATTTAALGPSWLKTTRGLGEHGEAPGLQVAWVGHDLEHGRRKEHKSRLTVPLPAPGQGCRDPRSSPPPAPPCPMAHTTSQPQG